jgi:hypothetical protein
VPAVKKVCSAIARRRFAVMMGSMSGLLGRRAVVVGGGIGGLSSIS